MKTETALGAENAELRARLEEAEETLSAIRAGEVDALIVGEQIYILESADAAANRFRGEVLAQVSDAIIAVDNDRRVTYLNPAAERQYGVSASTVLGCVLDEVLHFRWARPEDEAASQAALGASGVWRGENTHVKRNGEEINVESTVNVLRDGSGAVMGLLAIIRDITERKRIEETLRQSERQLRTLADSIPQLAWMAHPDGHVFWYNRRWYDYTGTAHAAMAGWGWQSVLDPEPLPRVLERWRASLETGEPFEMEFPLKGADGAFRWFLTRVNPLRDAQGRIVRWFGTNTDVDELRRTAEELRRANRLKDEFLATVSHELRTPLTAILGWARLLGGGQLDEATVTRALETIERNATAQAQLIDDLLDVSRIITGKLRLEVQPVDLAQVIATALDAALPAADAKGIRLERAFDAGASMVSGDPARLQQVVWNLFSNAIKFTPAGGRVEVKLERAGAHVEIVVTDDGQGISPHILPYVFERFRQADSSTTRAHGGLGLGLAIVRHLVEMHGGTVAAESAGVGHGATFTVRLPLVVVRPLDGRRADDGARAQAATTSDAAFNYPPELKGLRLLVVDDEEDTRVLLTTVLEKCGASVVSVASAGEALAALKEMRPHVLISDLGMPEEDGYALIKKVRALPAEAGGQTPSAALTAYARVEDRMRVLRSGFQIHIPKPVEPAELIAVVANLAGRTAK